MTAVLRILKGSDVLQELALRGVERIGGVTFYELDVDEILCKAEPAALTDNDRIRPSRPHAHTHDPDTHDPLPGQSDFPHEDTP